MNEQLYLDEAMALCRRLYLAQLAEESKRDTGDARRIARLEGLRQRAGKRWCRRAGFGPDVVAGVLWARREDCGRW